jgi:hypothetical protein
MMTITVMKKKRRSKGETMRKKMRNLRMRRRGRRR